MNIIMQLCAAHFKMAGLPPRTANDRHAGGRPDLYVRDVYRRLTVDKAGRKTGVKKSVSGVMALGTLVLGYCLMQFDNGTASSGSSRFPLG